VSANAPPKPRVARACPSCTLPMVQRTFAGRGAAAIDLDLCFDCQGIWFDKLESAALTPGSILELFQAIREREAVAQPKPLNDPCHCTVCRKPLALTHDFHKTTRISYLRCAEGHGRFTPFVQFLREKEFVRPLTPGEMTTLRAVVAQVRCSSCGAPIDLAQDAQCSYCHAPIEVLDGDAVAHTIAHLTAEEKARQKPMDPQAAYAALFAKERTESSPVDLLWDVVGLLGASVD